MKFKVETVLLSVFTIVLTSVAVGYFWAFYHYQMLPAVSQIIK